MKTKPCIEVLLREAYKIDSTHLNLSYKNIGNEDMPYLCSFLNDHYEITSLDLSNNALTFDGTIPLSKNKTLRALNFSGNSFSGYIIDENTSQSFCGISYIARMEKLTILDLTNCTFISNASLTNIMHHKSLLAISLSYTYRPSFRDDINTTLESNFQSMISGPISSILLFQQAIRYDKNSILYTLLLPEITKEIYFCAILSLCKSTQLPYNLFSNKIIEKTNNKSILSDTLKFSDFWKQKNNSVSNKNVIESTPSLSMK